MNDIQKAIQDARAERVNHMYGTFSNLSEVKDDEEALKKAKDVEEVEDEEEEKEEKTEKMWALKNAFYILGYIIKREKQDEKDGIKYYYYEFVKE